MKYFYKAMLVVLCCAYMSPFAFASTEWTEKAQVDKVNTIGQNLLKKSEIPIKVEFNVMETDEVNAFANVDKQIYVYTGLLKSVNDDAELAAVISHEIGHIINSHTTRQNVINVALSALLSTKAKSSNAYAIYGAQAAQSVSMLKLSRTDEYEADITGIDLIAKAGYNPLAMISFLYKISDNYVDVLSTHPSGDKRTMYAYNYILYNYPDKAKQGYNTTSFNNFKQYAQPIVDKRNSDAKATTKYNKEQAKLKKKRIEKLAKYKKAKQNSGWDNSFGVIRGTSALLNQLNSD